jgi:hypothetical protein
VIPQLPSGLDSTYTFTQSTPVSANAVWVVFFLCLLVGWIAWCFAYAYVEEHRADAKRPSAAWPSLFQHTIHADPFPEPSAPKSRKKGKKP